MNLIRRRRSSRQDDQNRRGGRGRGLAAGGGRGSERETEGGRAALGGKAEKAQQTRTTDERTGHNASEGAARSLHWP